MAGKAKADALEGMVLVAESTGSWIGVHRKRKTVVK
jgi:hypothetical protein